MLVSFAIVHKGGLVLFQHLNEAADTSQESLALSINTWLLEFYLNPTFNKAERKNHFQVHDATTSGSSGVGGGCGVGNGKWVLEWEETSELIAMAVYPDLRHEDVPWIRNLLSSMLAEYQVFLSVASASGEEEEEDKENDANTAKQLFKACSPENQELFDKTFQVLFQKYRSAMPSSSSSSHNHNITAPKNAAKPTSSNTASNSKGKEKRQWHDGKAKVTKEAMAELDRSKAVTKDDIQKSEDDALAEARAAYLPTDADLAAFASMGDTTTLVDDDENVDNDENESSSSSWGGSLQGLFQQMTGQKVLTKQDLDAPVAEIHKLLTSKNVAADIASQMCERVRQSLVGKKLNSMYRVKTAVRQALEQVINELLLPSTKLDLLRQVVSKRDRASSFFARNQNQRPYVIVVVGLNGVGKSTSLAKLAYYLKTNGCSPLLAACDTFRSGAVEQLAVHAKCLEIPLFSQGYSKDASNVAKAAIEEATKQGNDVVLVDTAGRMQNNLPLMKALGKLAAENQPDMVVFVGEALVGNDGVDQVQMFDKAISFQNKSQKVNAILLTKFDTVSDKVGAALTMTHVTNAPILFVGTGQKYHHLQKLSTASVIRSLFS